LAVAAAQWVPVAIAILGGAFLLMATRCLPPEEAYRSVEWKIVLLIASLLSLGAAMESTGTGRVIAFYLLGWLGEPHPLVLLAIFFVLTVALTQPMSNQAAAVVILPVAMQTALALELEPRPFGMMIAVAASCSYLTPLEPACLIVYGSGHYRFMDFFKVGMPLTLIIFALSLVLVPIVWPLRP
jgi:di/tricarboxylate transporter